MWRRARRSHGGDLSAAIADACVACVRTRGRQALLAWRGHAADTTPEQRDAIRAEWRGE